MKSSEVRSVFLEFFKSKQHLIVPSAPMVIKNDPTLMFTNAGMNQFKDVFLDIRGSDAPRMADTQKCLRVSGKHNDLEEVGHDTYHHTMFEMLGNWSFGDYFKQEAINWAWELMVDVYGIDPGNLYVTVFGGDPADGLDPDTEAFDLWKKHIPEERILFGSKKDNFWEMGETGPCGPCSEIHIDLRPDEEKKSAPGRDLVNADHHLVIEIWNLVFIQFNRKADQSLEQLPSKHVDTGMGFERLCMVLQGKKSNYDTDVFSPYINGIASISGIAYGSNRESDIAMRVIADHLRAVAFAIADGQLPSNMKAGYVIRRILRRAVRYGYTFLGFREPFIYRLSAALAREMGDQFPELRRQEDLIRKVINEEELAFLRTLETGIRRLDALMEEAAETQKKVISGETAFELYDTYGFPFDLTQLILSEKGLSADPLSFEKAMTAQKERSRKAAVVNAGDWVILSKLEGTLFTGYDSLITEAQLVRYRKVESKGKTLYHLVLDQTPFYAEAGGQVGDKGFLQSGDEKIPVIDTQKEHELIIHISTALPSDPSLPLTAAVNEEARSATASNHTATHLLHHALRTILGEHVEQKGSLVHADYLRFDFSHYQKLSPEELEEVERMVNREIRKDAPLEEMRNIPIGEAQEMGAMSLFGEKYGDSVRAIRFGDSIELCGGTHVSASGRIGLFRIVSEGAIAAGVRRIEAITAGKAEEWMREQAETVRQLKELLRNPKDPVKGAQVLLDQNTALQKQLDEVNRKRVEGWKKDGLANVQSIAGVNLVLMEIDADASVAKDLAFAISRDCTDHVVLIGSSMDGKAGLTLMVDENLVGMKGLDASKMIRELSPLIKGGGGGQAHFASAGGKDASGIPKAMAKLKEFFNA